MAWHVLQSWLMILKEKAKTGGWCTFFSFKGMRLGARQFPRWSNSANKACRLQWHVVVLLLKTLFGAGTNSHSIPWLYRVWKKLKITIFTPDSCFVGSGSVNFFSFLSFLSFFLVSFLFFSSACCIGATCQLQCRAHAGSIQTHSSQLTLFFFFSSSSVYNER